MLKLEGLLPQLPDKGPPLPRFMGKGWPKAKERPTEKRTREVRLPKPPEWMSRLPFESQIDKVLDRVSEAVRKSPVTKALERLHSRMPKLPSVEIPTPLGSIKLPAVTPLPDPRPPQIGAREKDILKASAGIDLASLITKVASVVPGAAAVAGFIEEELGDLYLQRMKGLMTPEEFTAFQKFDAMNPLDFLASWRALQSEQGKRKAK